MSNVDLPVTARVLVVVDSSFTCARNHSKTRARLEELFEIREQRIKEKKEALEVGLLACAYGLNNDGRRVGRFQTTLEEWGLKGIYEEGTNRKALFIGSRDEILSALDRVVYQGHPSHAITLDTALDFPFHTPQPVKSAILFISDRQGSGQVWMGDSDRKILFGLESGLDPQKPVIQKTEPDKARSIPQEPPIGQTESPGPSERVPELTADVHPVATEQSAPGDEPSAGAPNGSPSGSSGDTQLRLLTISEKANELGVQMWVWGNEHDERLPFDRFLTCNPDKVQSEFTDLVNKFLADHTNRPSRPQNPRPAQFSQDNLQDSQVIYRFSEKSKEPTRP